MEILHIFYCNSHYVGKVKEDGKKFLILDDCCRFNIVPVQEGGRPSIAINITTIGKNRPFVDGCKFLKDLIVFKEDGTDLYKQFVMIRNNITPAKEGDITGRIIGG